MSKETTKYKRLGMKNVFAHATFRVNYDKAQSEILEILTEMSEANTEIGRRTKAFLNRVGHTEYKEARTALEEFRNDHPDIEDLVLEERKEEDRYSLD